MVTSICGSSSRGVIITATTPSSRPSRARIGVSGLAWNVRAMRPEMPKRGGSGRVVISLVLACRDQCLTRCHRVGGDGLAGLQAGDYFDISVPMRAQAELAQCQ